MRKPTDGKSSIGGAIAVAITPCRGEGVVDPVAMGLLCEHLGATGCRGIFVAGSTGEMSLLGEGERRELTSAARESAAENVTIYSGVSGLGIQETIRYTKNAANDGANVGVLMAPLFFSFAQAEIVRYMHDVAEASPIPIALYHHPRMPTPLSPKAIAELAKHPNICAVKYTSSSIQELKAVLAAVEGSDIAVLQGSESIVCESYAAGADDGMVAALAGVMPEWFVKLHDSLHAGDQAAAEAVARQIKGLWSMFNLPSVQGSISRFVYTLKIVLQRRGWLERLDSLMPGFVPSDSLRIEVANHLDKLGITEGFAIPHEEKSKLRVDPAGSPTATMRPTNVASPVERN